jgi:hypothetical protein
MITFVDPRHVRPKRDPGHTFIIAGFRPVGLTRKEKLVALQLAPDRMPEAAPAIGQQAGLFDEVAA